MSSSNCAVSACKMSKSGSSVVLYAFQFLIAVDGNNLFVVSFFFFKISFCFSMNLLLNKTCLMKSSLKR